MGDMYDLLKYHAPILGGIPTFSDCAFIGAGGRETGFIHRDGRLHEKLSSSGYDTLASMKDVKSGVYSTVCTDPSAHLVERVIAAMFCSAVAVTGLVAVERNERLEMPSITVMASIDDESLKQRLPWLTAAVVFANKCSKYGDLSTHGTASYSLNLDVKKAWNEFMKNAPGLFLYGPRYTIGWKEELPVDNEIEEKRLSPIEVVKMMKTHPKNDREVDVSLFRSSLAIDWIKPAE